MTEREVPIAGGVVWRQTSDTTAEVVLVHRTQHNDWSFPKGLVEPGEDDLDCALREVEEETGLRCRAGPELATIRYLDLDGRRKAVRYWAMQPELANRRDPDDEIDEIRWCSPTEARAHFTYPEDGRVLDAFEASIPPQPPGSQLDP